MLRCIVTAIALVLTASALEAQQHAFDVRSLQIGGSASFTSMGNDDDFGDGDRLTTISLNPQLHYFVAERFAVGADVSLSYASFSNDGSARTLGLGPSLTYYFGASTAKVHPYLSARASISWVRFESATQESDGSGRSGTVAGGILSMLSRSVGITTELFYRLQRTEIQSQESDTNTFGLAVGVAAFVF